MNKILIAVNVLLIAAVIFLFYKVYDRPSTETAVTEKDKTEVKSEETKPPAEEKPVQQVGNAPTGKIAYVDIDRLNEESLEIIDLIAESKRRKNNIEASVESL